MKYAWATNLYDRDGDEYEKCILAFVGDSTILRFKNSEELEDFANEILHSLKEIREQED